MTVHKNIEITSESKKGFDDAISVGIKKAAQTVNNIRSVWIKDQSCTVKNGKIASYRVNMKVTFGLGVKSK